LRRPEALGDSAEAAHVAEQHRDDGVARLQQIGTLGQVAR